MKKQIIDYLKQNISNLSNLTLNNLNFKTQLLNSLNKINGDNPDFNISDGDDFLDSASQITELNSSIMAAIDRFSNFNGDDVSSLYQDLEPNYWNESVKETINNLHNIIDGLEGRIEKIADTNVSYADILKANAGETFERQSLSDIIQKTNWVRPSLDMYYSKYGQVRNEFHVTGDGVLSVLEKISNLNFTHTQDQPVNWEEISKNIRLIMPKNSRRVEIEDLNRNFWVIAQTLSAISSFLFGDMDNSFIGILERLLDEMLQIWDNILWLWLILLGSIMEENSIHIECVTVYDGDSDYIRSFERHLDDFTARKAINRTLSILAQKYPNRNLVILLQIREDNYMYDYYKKESYPYLCVKGKNWSSWKKIELKIDMGDDIWRDVSFSISSFLGEKDLSENIGQIMDAGKTQKFSYPAILPPSNEGRWFKALRITPLITAEVGDNEDEINITQVQFKVFDVASQGQLIKSEKPTYFTQPLYTFSFEKKDGLKIHSGAESNATIYLTSGEKDPIIPEETLKSYSNEINYYERNGQSYYLGELVSDFSPFILDDSLPFGEWFHLRPLQKNDNSSSITQLNGAVINKIDTTKAAIKEKIYEDGTQPITASLSEIGKQYSGHLHGSNNPISVTVLSRAYESPFEKDANSSYDYTYDFYNGQNCSFEKRQGKFNIYGDQIIGIYININSVGNESRLNSGIDSIFLDKHTLGNIGNIVHYSNLYCKSAGYSIMWFPHCIEYFGGKNVPPAARLKNSDWFVRITALSVQEVDADQIKVNNSPNIKDYNGRKAVLTSKIVIYAVPVYNNGKTIVGMKLHLIQKNYPLTINDNNQITNIDRNAKNTFTATGGADFNDNNFNGAFKKNSVKKYNTKGFSYKYHQRSVYGNGDLLDLFNSTDNFVSELIW